MTHDDKPIGAQEKTIKQILRTPEAANHIGLSASTLGKTRLTREGPSFVRLGGRAVDYNIRALDHWLEQQCDGDPEDPTAA